MVGQVVGSSLRQVLMLETAVSHSRPHSLEDCGSGDTDEERVTRKDFGVDRGPDEVEVYGRHVPGLNSSACL